MAPPTGPVDGIGRAEAQVAATRRRATRSGEVAARHEDLAETGPSAMRQFHQDAAAVNRRMQERHLISAGIHAAHATRMRAAARAAMLTAAPVGTPESADVQPGGQAQRVNDRIVFDHLTGLPNRRLFAEQLALAIEGEPRGQPRDLAICLVDVDFFGSINDRFGRRQADRVLATIAQRLVDCAPSRLVARWGGNQFAVLLEGSASGEEAPELAARIVTAVNEPIILGGTQMSVSASVGVAHRDTAKTGAAELLRSATISLGWAKKDGRRRWEVFDSDRDEEATARGALAADLPLAISHGELVVEYQPVVSLADGHIVGVEALVRWKHPTHGLLGPDRFVDLAEEHGLLGQIDAIVLARACDDAMRWHRNTSARIFVSVNVDARQLEDPALGAHVSSVLDQTGLPAASLHLEILEGAIVRWSGRSVPTLHHLADLGIPLAIDDFGTGYSNLSYLGRLPVKILKTDRSFVTDLCPPDRGPDDAGTEIFSTIVSLAQVLGLTVTAEGVETLTQAEWLQSMGVETAQGWYFGRPVAADKIETALGVTVQDRGGSRV